jgi:hypothetical protein
MTSLFLVLFAASLQAQLPGRYTRYQQALQTLVILESTYPEVCNLDTMGFSTRDSIPMLRVKISDNVQLDEDEPAVFYCGGVHADEVLGVEVVMWFIQNLLYRYSQQDTVALRYINEIEIFCVPYINPEGHIVVEEGDTAWRKNKCDNDTNGFFDFHDGVDNNRNYDFGWSLDNAPDAIVPESLQYKGRAPFTQTENIAMAAFARKYLPLVALDYHSPTYGRSEVAYFPWYWASQGFAPDEALMGNICRQFCSRIVDDRGDSTYEARRALVDKGDFKTYFYGNFGSVSFSVEISDTTIQDSTMVDDICNRHLPGQYYLMERALGSGITGIIRDSVTLEPIEAEVVVVERSGGGINPRLSRPDTGRYRRVLESGAFTLRFQKPGYRTRTSNVVVPGNRPLVVDMFLPPINPRPPAPVLIFPSPDTVIYDTSITYAWRQSPYAQYYLLELYADSTLTMPLYADSLVADTVVTPVFVPADTLIYWRVKGGNQYGWGPYSASQSFLRFSTPPAPMPAFPPPDTIISDSVLTFHWHSLAAADRYLLEIYTDSAMTAPLYIDSTIIDTSFVSAFQPSDSLFTWRLKGGNLFGWGPYSEPWSFAFYQISGIGGVPPPKDVGLGQNYPNPFNARTSIPIDLLPGTGGELAIFDIAGRLVKSFALNGSDAGGRQRVVWDAVDSYGQPVKSGLYFFRLRVGDSALTKKMVLLK